MQTEMDSPTAMNFTENQQANVILDKIRIQKDKGRFCDVIFHLKDQEFLAHRNVLAACSPYFDSMLKMNKVAKEHMTINCTDHKVFEMLLEYVYTGKIIIDLNIVAELLRLSNQFMITKLKAYCSEYLERNLFPGNCFWTKELAERCGLQTLGKTAEAYMLANIIEVVEQNEVLEFPVARMEAFLSNKSLPLLEELKVHLINRWTRRYLDDRVSLYQLLLSYILWDKVNMYAVCKMLADDPLFASSEWCMYSMLQTVHDSVHVLPEGYTDTLEHLKEKLVQHPTMNSNRLMHLAISAAIGDLKDHAREDRGDEKVDMDVMSSEKTVLSPAGGTADNTDVSVCVPTEAKIEKKENNSANAMNGNHGYKAMDEDSDTDDYDAEDESFARSLQIADQTAEEEDEKTNAVEEAKEVDKTKEEDCKDSKLAVRQKYDGRAKHKRKGIPVKVRIPKSKIKYKMCVPKKRGRGRLPKLSCKKVNKSKHTGLMEAKVEKPQTDDAEREHVSCDDDDDDDIDEIFGDNDDHDYSPSDGDAPTNESKEKRIERRGRKRKLHEKFSCPKCFYVTMSSAKLDHHLEHAHRDDTTYACSVCNFKSMWNREYYHHMKEHFPGPPFECDNEDCDYSADRIQPLLYHRMVHTNERPYECTVCNMRFRTKNNLTTHLRCHTGEKPFKCSICERCFATKGTLEQHSVTHSDHRPYLCDTCGFSTKYQSHLIAHKRIHTGDVFHCQYSNCKYLTPKRSQLACHMRSHMSIRSHICSVCGRAFVEKSHLVRHERIHLDDKPFKCGDCEYSSTRRDKLKEHAIKYHSVDSTVKIPFKPRKPRRQSFSPNAFPGISQEQAEAQMQGHITIQPTTMGQGNVTHSHTSYSHYTLTNMQSPSQYTHSGENRVAAPPNYSYLLNTTCGSTSTTNMAIEPSIASYENSNISNSSSAVVSSPVTMMPHQIGPQHMLPPGRGCIDAMSNVAAAAAAACVSMGGVSTVDRSGLGLMMDPHSLPTMVPHLLPSTMMTSHHHQRLPLDMNAQQHGVAPVGYPPPQPSPHPSHPSTPQPPPVHPQQLSSPPPQPQQQAAQQPQQPQQQQQPQQDFTGLHAFMGMYL